MKTKKKNNECKNFQLSKEQVYKILNDSVIEECELKHILYSYSLKIKSIKCRLKIVKRKILLFKKKFNETEEDIIKFSCNDFDNLDFFL